MAEEAIGVIQKFFGDAVMLRLLNGHFSDLFSVQAEDDGIRVTQEHGGMRGDDELGFT